MVQPLPAFLACDCSLPPQASTWNPSLLLVSVLLHLPGPSTPGPTIPSVQLSPILLPQLYTYLNNRTANILLHGAHLSMAKGCILLIFSFPTSNPAPNPAPSRAALLN